MSAKKFTIRSILEGFYLLCGGLSAFFLLAILLAIIVQVLSRWTGIQAPGSQAYAGYFMAASSFLALSYTFGHGGHIRVSLFLNSLGKHRWWGEVFCLLIGSLASGYFAYYAIKGTYWSYKFHDVSPGLDATPLWIPQIAMSFGAVAFCIAIVDLLIRVARPGPHCLKESEIMESHL